MMLSLGQRMKWHEQRYSQTIPPGSYTIIRVDGRAFRTATRRYGAERPFDYSFMEVMDATAGSMCSAIQNSLLAYVQSDEISVLATNVDTKSGLWFGGNMAKTLSVSAGRATSAFMWNMRVLMGQHWNVEFDSHVFTVPDEVEAANYFVSRQVDWQRNSVNMAAQAHFPHADLIGKPIPELKSMLLEKGVDWDAYPERIRMGRVCVRQGSSRDVAYVDPRIDDVLTAKVERQVWQVDAAPLLSADPGGWLAPLIPSFGNGA